MTGMSLALGLGLTAQRMGGGGGVVPEGEIRPAFLAGQSQIFAPTVTPGLITVSPSLLAASSQIFAPVVTPGPITVSPALLAAGGSLYSPTVSTGGSYDADATTYFAAMSVQPDATRKGLINTLILALKSAGSWSKMDLLYLVASHDAQAARLNVKNPALYALSTVNSPTFTTDRGYAGDGASAHLAMGWAPNNGAQFLQNSAHMGFYVNSLGANRHLTGRGTAGGPVLFYADAAQVRLNQPTSIFPTGGLSGNGWVVGDRANSSTAEIRVNGSQVNSTAHVSAARDADALFILRAATSYGNSRVAVASFGASIAAEDAATYSAINTFLTAIGAN